MPAHYTGHTTSEVCSCGHRCFSKLRLKVRRRCCYRKHEGATVLGDIVLIHVPPRHKKNKKRLSRS